MAVNFAADIYGSSRTNPNNVQDPVRPFPISSPPTEAGVFEYAVTPQHLHDGSGQNWAPMLLLPGRFRGRK